MFERQLQGCSKLEDLKNAACSTTGRRWEYTFANHIFYLHVEISKTENKTKCNFYRNPLIFFIFTH